MAGSGDGSPRTRQLAVLVADGVDSATLKPLREALQAEGVRVWLVGPWLGTVRSASQRKLEVDATFATLPSVMFDGVLLPAGAQAATALAALGDAQHYVREAYKHCKTLCAVGEGAQLLSFLAPAEGEPWPDGVLLAPTPAVTQGDVDAVKAIAQQLAQALGQHRHWGRLDLENVPA